MGLEEVVKVDTEESKKTRPRVVNVENVQKEIKTDKDAERARVNIIKILEDASYDEKGCTAVSGKVGVLADPTKYQEFLCDAFCANNKDKTVQALREMKASLKSSNIPEDKIEGMVKKIDKMEKLINEGKYNEAKEKFADFWKKDRDDKFSVDLKNAYVAFANEFENSGIGDYIVKSYTNNNIADVQIDNTLSKVLSAPTTETEKVGKIALIFKNANIDSVNAAIDRAYPDQAKKEEVKNQEEDLCQPTAQRGVVSGNADSRVIVTKTTEIIEEDCTSCKQESPCETFIDAEKLKRKFEEVQKAAGDISSEAGKAKFQKELIKKFSKAEFQALMNVMGAYY